MEKIKMEKGLSDNGRTAIGYVCIALVVMAWIIGGAWILSPSEFTFKIEMDNNTRDAVESVEYPIISINESRGQDNFMEENCGAYFETLIKSDNGFYYKSHNRTIDFYVDELDFPEVEGKSIRVCYDFIFDVRSGTFVKSKIETGLVEVQKR